jgi:hypothetical protein
VSTFGDLVFGGHRPFRAETLYTIESRVVNLTTHHDGRCEQEDSASRVLELHHSELRIYVGSSKYCFWVEEKYVTSTPSRLADAVHANDPD